MGHLMNKVLKDIVNRYHLLQGKRVFFTPGWDTHGLPIELKVTGSPEMRGRSPFQTEPQLIRRLAREYAGREIERQKQEFKELAILADWSGDTYQTYDSDYEMKQLEVIAELASKGLIYHALKPVHFSPQTRTALADAELEYRDNHMSRSVFVPFGLRAGATLQSKLTYKSDLDRVAEGKTVDFEALIWTTTPWSLPGNMALAVNPQMKYCIVQPKEGTPSFRQRKFVVALDRVDYISKRKLGLDGPGGAQRPTVGELEVTSMFDGADLLDSTYIHPFHDRRSPPRPVLPADYVTAESGTGLVHTAPAHGMEDYQLCLRHGLIGDASAPDLLSPISDSGRFTDQLAEIQPDAKALVGAKALGEGSVMLVQWLEERGYLLCELPLQHRYAYDWRSKTPVMMRATPQWFIDVSSLKQKAQEALRNVNFVPPSSRARLEKTISSRNEWCISRQRVWGVPIPVVYDKDSGMPLLTAENVKHIISILREKGTDYWWEGQPEEFVAPQYRGADKQWRVGTDTIDVWFDSGVSWAAAHASPAAQGEGKDDIADLVVEGTDQHRGWFQSSLLTKLAFSAEGEAPQAPYKTVATHGYVLNRRHEKMSKSLGNFIDPMVLLKGGAKKNELAWGADTLRLWVAKSYAWESDVNISQLQAKHANEDLRKLRNTARFMLANLPSRDQTPSLDDEIVQKAFTLLDRFILAELHGLDVSCRAAYEELNYAGVVRRLSEFMNTTLSALYFSVIKDNLYANSIDDPKRQAAVAVCDQILRTTVSILAPIVPHLAEEIWHYRGEAVRDPPAEVDPGAPREQSFFESGWQKVDEKWDDPAAVRDWRKMQKLRNELLSLIEEARQDKLCKSGVELEVFLSLSEEGQGAHQASRQLIELCKEHQADLPDFLGAAHVHLTTAPPEVRLDEAGKKIWYLTRSLHSSSTLAPAPAETQGASADEFEALVESAASQSDGSNDVQDGKALPQIQLTIRPAQAARCPRCWIHRAPSPLVACDRCLGVMHKKEVAFVDNATYSAQAQGGEERGQKTPAGGEGQAGVASTEEHHQK